MSSNTSKTISKSLLSDLRKQSGLSEDLKLKGVKGKEVDFTDPKGDEIKAVKKIEKTAKKAVKEDTLNEISKDLANRYYDKSYDSSQKAKNSIQKRIDAHNTPLGIPSSKEGANEKRIADNKAKDAAAAEPGVQRDMKTYSKRVKGMSLAADKIDNHKVKVSATESVESLDELSKTTLTNYIDKATEDRRKITTKARAGEATDRDLDRRENRRKGSWKALNKIYPSDGKYAVKVPATESVDTTITNIKESVTVSNPYTKRNIGLEEAAKAVAQKSAERQRLYAESMEEVCSGNISPEQRNDWISVERGKMAFEDYLSKYKV